ncbi:MAG: hypothetical protein JSS49_18980 [Planctomycetes bacterium]|nr:hypothetical protein [Planctomycetota bacterium]
MNTNMNQALDAPAEDHHNLKAPLCLSPQTARPVNGPQPPRVRRANAITWAFAPGTPQISEWRAAAADGVPPLTSLIVWIDNSEADECSDVLVTTHPDEIHRLHVSLNERATSSTMLAEVLAELCAVIATLIETYSVSSNHVYLAGRGDGGAAALRLLLMQPESFRGIAMFNAEVSTLPVLIDVDTQLQKHRALLVTSIEHSSRVRQALQFGRLLHSAGMLITTHVSDPRVLTHEQMFRDLAEWVKRDRLLYGTHAD